MRDVYYNDHDPFVCSWLRELIKAAELPPGEVDDRSILDVEPDDLRPFRQCHFFAGVGGWPRALILAGFPADREIWTASLPCQPLSVAGKREGDADERHLWPAFYRLVAFRRPARIVGEQVASADGREWLAGIRADLADAGYACGGANLPACAFGAPHRRERLYWCAMADAASRGQQHDVRLAGISTAKVCDLAVHKLGDDCNGGGVADADQRRRQVERIEQPRGQQGPSRRVPDRRGDVRQFDDAKDAVANAEYSERGQDSQGRHVDHRHDRGRDQAPGRSAACGAADGAVGDAEGGSSGTGFRQRGSVIDGHGARGAGFWDGAEWRVGADGKARRVKSGVRLLAHGFPNRVGLLRGFGNAIVPQAAALFLRALP